MLNWILNPTHVLAVLIALALLTPILALATPLRRLPRNQRIVAAAGGPLILVMWFAYNSIMNAFGLDSLIAMGINLLLFLFVGAVAGLYISRSQ